METGHGGAARSVGRTSRLVQRALLATARPPLLGAWRRAYIGAARLAGWALTAGIAPEATTYARGSIASGSLVPGLSDVDLVIVVPDGAPDVPSRVHRRWETVRRRAPLLTHLVDRPRVHTEAELHRLAGRSPYTFGLTPTGAADAAAGALTGTDLLDRNRALERPGAGDPRTWRPVGGPTRALPTAAPDAQATRIAAWLELVYLWKRAYEALADPTAPHTAALCVKLVSAPAAAHALLTGAAVRSDPDALLRHAALLAPERAEAIERVRGVAARLRTLPAPPLADAVAGLCAVSARVADVLEQALAGAGRIEVELRGATAEPALPLCDWQALVRPGATAATFVPEHAPLDVDRLRCGAQAAREGMLHAVVDGPLLAFPSTTRSQVALRAVACAPVDPVSTALVAGEPRARFVEVDGWSAGHWARRAVAEHRAALAAAPAPTVAAALAAARAELLRLTLAEGAPLLATTHAATLDLLDERTDLGDGVAALHEALATGAGLTTATACASDELVRAVALLAAQP
jgi:hypothetical protein